MTHKESLNNDGYVVVQNLIPTSVCDEVTDYIHAVFKKQLEILEKDSSNDSGNSGLLADMKTLFDNDLDAYLACARTLAKIPHVHTALMHKAIISAIIELGITQPIIPTGPVVHIMAEELKVPGGYYGFSAHQDWPSMQGSLEGLIVWIPLVDIDAHFYPLEVIPGSHLQGIWPGENIQQTREIDPSLYKDEDFLPVEVKRGDVVFVSLFTVHRSGIKGANGVRMACSLRYENMDEATFVERGYPSAYKRVVERELMIENFPSKEQVQAIYKSTKQYS